MQNKGKISRTYRSCADRQEKMAYSGLYAPGIALSFLPRNGLRNDMRDDILTALRPWNCVLFARNGMRNDILTALHPWKRVPGGARTRVANSHSKKISGR